MTIASMKYAKSLDVPSPITLKEGAILAYENALELYEEALILFRYKKYPRVVSLTIFAAEEISKHILLASAIGIKRSKEKFWTQFFSHAKKLLSAEIMDYGATGMESLNNDPKNSAHLFNDSKMIGLYVNYAILEKKFISPKLISRQIASNSLKLCRGRIQWIKPQAEAFKSMPIDFILKCGENTEKMFSHLEKIRISGASAPDIGELINKFIFNKENTK